MPNYKLTKEEQLIENEIDLLEPVAGKKKEKISKIINQAKKNKAISLRVSNNDLERIKAKAQAQGIPYQTLITSVLHKYVTNQFFEKQQVIESFNLISKAGK